MNHFQCHKDEYHREYSFRKNQILTGFASQFLLRPHIFVRAAGRNHCSCLNLCLTMTDIDILLQLQRGATTDILNHHWILASRQNCLQLTSREDS